MADIGNIWIKGARVNNLKHIDVQIPRNKLVVITGLSGSGKSSLAFDTLYAEGQRRYVESLSAYARQFLGRMSKPECDFIKGIPPAIAIEQRVNTRNPRSTVGTSTEIYEYLRLLFARIGKTISPISGQEVKKHQVADIVRDVLSYPIGTRFTLLAPIQLPEGRTLPEQLDLLQKEGFSRVEIDGKPYRINEALTLLQTHQPERIELLVDRLAVSDEKSFQTRLTDSAETAFYEGHNACTLCFYLPEGTERRDYSKRFEADGIQFEEPSEMMFSFNNPLGACPTCEGFGKVLGIDEHLVVPDQSLSLYEGAVVCWKGEVMGEWKTRFIQESQRYNFPIHRPYFELSEAEKELLWHGAKGLHGIDDFFRFVGENQYKIQYRVMMARYRGKTTCPTCKGSRLKPEALYVQVGGKNIAQIVAMPITETKAFFDQLTLNETDRQVAKRLLSEINSRLQFLLDVGLGYLTLDRLSSTLSGGESQRINIATSLGSSLVGSLYILDEPSIGLHQRDNVRLIQSLRNLRDTGNTVVVVEHDRDMMMAADYIIDMGPGAGRLGGEVVYQGTPQQMLKEQTLTARYLNNDLRIEIPQERRKGNGLQLTLSGARGNNLKDVTATFPLGTLTCITGVSGSGKSTLINDTLLPILSKHFYRSLREPLAYDSLDGIEHIDKVVAVDQSPLGRTPRSNPATYTGIFSDIRSLYVGLPEAKIRGYKPGRFSFNVRGGRCETCKGNGYKTIEMNFLPDVYVPCEHCHGKRYNRETLEVRFKGKSIADVLDMTVNRAVEFFENVPHIQHKIKVLQDVGLGYIKLGQSSTTLSGGESQRVKLATELAKRDTGRTIYILDEPTTGLHFEDIRVLLGVLQRLVDRGNTVIVIEHNLDIVKAADYIIDMGPEGGRNGGTIVAMGTPEEVAAAGVGHTAPFLAAELAR